MSKKSKKAKAVAKASAVVGAATVQTGAIMGTFAPTFSPTFGSNIKVPIGDPEGEQGQSGAASFGGFIRVGEVNPRLEGMGRYRTAADILNNFSMVVAGFRSFQTLVSMAGWSVQPAKDINDGKDSSDEAKRMADFMQSVMDNTETSWQRIVRRASMFKFHGFGIHEWVADNRADGRFGIKNIEMRPCHTIYRWILDPKGHVNGVIQRVPNNMSEIPISRQKFIHMVDDGMTDNPEGLGLWRQLAEPWDRMKEYLRLEGIGFERDLRGIPFGKAPLAALDAAVKAGQITTTDKIDMIRGFTDFVTMESKTSKTGIVADSSSYVGITADGNTVSTVPMWDMKLLTAQSTSLADLGKAIERLRYDAAMILGMEHLLLGSTSSGSRALSATKAQALAQTVNSCSMDIASTFDRDLTGPIWTLNGFDPKLKPKFKVEDAGFKDIASISTALANLAMAGARTGPGEEAVNQVRDLAGLARQTEADVKALQAGDEAAANAKKPPQVNDPKAPKDVK